MNAYFSQPWLLLIVVAYAVFVGWQWRVLERKAGGSALARRRGMRCLSLHAGAAACLVLAAAGLQFPSTTARQTVIIAVDVSDSIFDLPTQSTRLRELVKGLDTEKIQLGVVVFGGTAGVECQIKPLEREETKSTKTMRGRSVSEPSIPDLSRLTAVVDRSTTDIGSAINFARGLFPAEDGAKAVLLLSDFRNTQGSAQAAALALQGSGIDLLASSAVLGSSTDVHIAAVRAPEHAAISRALPLEVTVASQSACSVQVSVWREKAGSNAIPVGSKTVVLSAAEGKPGVELRSTVTIVDHPDAPGIAVYTARITGTDGQIANDVNTNNQLSTAVNIIAPSRWAVLSRSGSTLHKLCTDAKKPLGAETQFFDLAALPQRASAYDAFAGILVDGFSVKELGDGPAARALTDAVESGKSLVAIGGEKAFGAGGHREGAWESLLPIEMTPEDDRTRSVLFLIDVSKSMEQKMGRDGSGVRKIDFAAEQLAQAVQKLKPLDRLGLITFSGTAQVAAPLSTDPSRSAFLNAVKNMSIQANTDLLKAIQAAQNTLKNDDAEEQLVVFLSDGVQTVPVEPDAIVNAARQLCALPSNTDSPRRTTLYTFGIGVDPSDSSDSGEKLLKALAEAGGGSYSPQFLKLAERLEKAFEAEKKDFYVRREPFTIKSAVFDHALVPQATQWPVLPFRNRVKAKQATETLLLSTVAEAKSGITRKADPLLVVSGSQWAGASRRAALALSLDGAAGSAFLNAPGTARILPGLLDWAEARKDETLKGWRFSAESRDDDTVEIEVRAQDPITRQPVNGRKLSGTLSVINVGTAPPPVQLLPSFMLHPSAPGVYRAIVPAPASGVYRLAIQMDGKTIHERFVSLPYPAELRRFGTDRAAMQDLVAKAGKNGVVIESSRDLAQWAATKEAAFAPYSLRSWLVACAVALLLLEFAARGRRA